jgi:hypothetical protein
VKTSEKIAYKTSLQIIISVSTDSSITLDVRRQPVLMAKEDLVEKDSLAGTENV